MGELFKDRAKTKADCPALAEKLREALAKGEEELKLLMLGTTQPELYKDHGRYQLGEHQHCRRLEGDSFAEDRLCRCLYFNNSVYREAEECENCGFKERYKLIGKYKIKDYQVPAYYYGDGIGKIDLVLADGETLYATEVKPYKGNAETLLRMVAEIITYTLGTSKYNRAIAFFEGTPQDEEYGAISSTLKEILEKAEITVFRFEKREGDTYEICKL